MGFSINARQSVRRFIVSATKASILTTFMWSAGVAQAATVNIPDTSTGHLSTLQVKTAVKKLHKGRIIYTKRTAKPGFPNCHIVKMITTTGEFKYIRYACTAK